MTLEYGFAFGSERGRTFLGVLRREHLLADLGLSSRDIFVELGHRKTVGGQEDLIEDIAFDMVCARQS